MRRLVALAVLTVLAAVPGTAGATPHGTLRLTSAKPGRAVTVAGRVTGARRVKLQVLVPGGAVRGPYGPYAVRGKRLRATLPAAATAQLGRDVRDLAVAVLPATATRTRRDAPAAGRIDVPSPTAGLTLTNSFVSAKGWVKPGDTFPLTVTVRNDAEVPADGGTVTIPPVAGMSFTKVEDGDATIDGGTVKWAVGALGPVSSKRVVLEATAATTDAGRRDRLEGPVDDRHLDRGRHLDQPRPQGHPAVGDLRHGALRRPAVPRRPRRLLRPQARHRAAAPTSSQPRSTTRPTRARRSTSTRRCPTGSCSRRATSPRSASPRAATTTRPASRFSKRAVKADTCVGTTAADLPLPVETTNPERIHDGWYQLPGDTGYYGSDSNGSALIGALSRRRRAAEHRLAAAARPARPSTTRRRSPTRRSTTTRSTPTRTASSTSS